MLVLSICRTFRSGFTLTVNCRESPLQTLCFSYCSRTSTAANIHCQTGHLHTPLFAQWLYNRDAIQHPKRLHEVQVSEQVRGKPMAYLLIQQIIDTQLFKCLLLSLLSATMDILIQYLLISLYFSNICWYGYISPVSGIILFYQVRSFTFGMAYWIGSIFRYEAFMLCLPASIASKSSMSTHRNVLSRTTP